MVWACVEKRRRIRREERVMDLEVPGKGEEDRSGGGWITSRKTCRRENCQGRKRKTEFNDSLKTHFCLFRMSVK